MNKIAQLIKDVKHSIKKDVLAGKTHGVNHKLGHSWSLSSYNAVCWRHPSLTQEHMLEVGMLTTRRQVGRVIKLYFSDKERCALEFTKETIDKIYDDHINGAVPIEESIKNIKKGLDKKLFKLESAEREEKLRKQQENMVKLDVQRNAAILKQRQDQIILKQMQDETKLEKDNSNRQRLKEPQKNNNNSELKPTFYFILISIFIIFVFVFTQ